MDKALALKEQFCSQHDIAQRFDIACTRGLEGELSGKKLSSWAEDLMDIAVTGLEEWQPESVSLLTPLIKQVETGQSPAQQILQTWKQNPSPEGLISTISY